MADIVIKKKITLEFLGDHYKDSYLVFKSIPVSEYSELMKEASAVGDDNQKAMLQLIDILEKYFVSGIFEEQKLTKDDIKQFDGDTILRCFELLTGQIVDQEGNTSLDPKSESESTNTSSTDTE